MKRVIFNVQTNEQYEEEISEQEILAMEAQMQAEFAAIPYTDKRAVEYPSITEYLDGIVKGDQAQIDKYIADCLAVKAKYPKPL